MKQFQDKEKNVEEMSILNILKKLLEELKTKYSKEKDEHERTKAQEWGIFKQTS